MDSVVSGRNGSFQTLFTDMGFFNTAVRPALEDSGLDGTDDFGVPFSIAVRQGATPLAITGAFKIPSLRNVEFTGPYFHNGSQASLEQVIDFYTRGGDFPDSTGVPAEIMPLAIDAAVRAEIVAFPKLLSDDRVRYERAPFDHPELCVPVAIRIHQRRTRCTRAARSTCGQAFRRSARAGIGSRYRHSMNCSPVSGRMGAGLTR